MPPVAYPAPLATHERVVEEPEVFWDTLKKFHLSAGTKFMVPVIGGKELDLHLLYVEVTRRGGYDQVVSEKKWREISSVFKFSPTTTSASFVLKKHYQTYLFYYEKVYFSRLQGPHFSSSAHPPDGASPLRTDVTGNEEYRSFKGVDGSSDSPTGSEEPLSFLAVGTIDAKFDCGYVVSVKMGSEILRGVLYHPRPRDAPSTSPLAANANLSRAIVPYDPNLAKKGKKRRRKLKKRRWGWDPSHPKPNRSGYNFFFAEKHSALKSQYPNREREFTKMIGESWTSLAPEERMVYQNIGLKDKERYRRELKEYKENLKLRQLAEAGSSGAKL